MVLLVRPVLRRWRMWITTTALLLLSGLALLVKWGDMGADSQQEHVIRLHVEASQMRILWRDDALFHGRKRASRPIAGRAEALRRRMDNDYINTDNSESEEAFHDAVYGGGPEETEDEIDCSMFQHLDELPPFCLEAVIPPLEAGSSLSAADENAPVQGGIDGSTSSSGTTIATVTPTEDSSGFEMETTLVDDSSSSIYITLSLGIHQFDQMTEGRARLLVATAVRTLGELLDRYTPYVAALLLPPENENGWDDGDGRRLIMSNLRQNRQLDESASGEDEGVDENTINTYVPSQDEGVLEIAALLNFSNALVWESPSWESWLHLSVQYSVFWPNGEQVVSPDLLLQIESECREALNMTLDANKFWNELLEVGSDGGFVSHPGEPLHNDDEATIVAVAKFGAEYAIDPEQHSPGYDSSTDEETSGKNTPTDQSGSPYAKSAAQSMLTNQWELREWLGLGLFAVTLLTATLLTVLSAYVQHHRAEQGLWGEAGGLTEKGVGELLTVGWAYHQQEGRDGYGNQLYLHVYNKGKIGYNDDNSILQGSFRQKHNQSSPPPKGPVSATATTSTPNSEETPRSSTS